MSLSTYSRALVLLTGIFFTAGTLSAQNAAATLHFLDYQRSIPKVLDLLNRKEDTLIRQFREKGLVWPARYIYLRSFKYDSQLEVWVKNSKEEKYQLFKTFKVCAMAGTLGPKRMAGDYQVPEGFYYINEFNPKSEYHLSLGLNYPNESDNILSDSVHPGGDIYIHGSCVTTGCIPITDAQIEELYVLAVHAKDMGEDFIPVHIFPVNFSNPRSVEYLNKYLQTFPEYATFARSMRSAFNYFEKYREVPFALVNGKGEYVTDDVAPAEALVKVPNLEPVAPAASRKKPVHVRPDRISPIPESQLATAVDKLPEYPGGNTAFQVFLNKVSRESIKDLAGATKAFVMVEYVIDSSGKAVYAKAIRGGNETMDEKIEDAFLAMPQWAPASRSGTHVAMKLKQTVMVGAD
ncbi:MAG TPA: L,D-transpeptidase family protein [Puia sp.]|nr:L,D-transpeptidase family protein [Puia sp.]